MHALFHVLPAPDVVLPTLVEPLHARVMEAKQGCPPLYLAKLLFLLGQACVCTLVFTERIATVAKRSGGTVAAKGDGDGDGGEAKEGADAMEEEMGMVAAADAEHERIFHGVTERELALDDDQLLGKFHRLVAFIVANQRGQYSHPVLRETAVMALCRYMAVSSELCEMYLPLLFTVVEREHTPAVRTSIVIALGDLAFRFPNSLEPWTAKFYARLMDADVTVRYNTLMTLTHLILNDMIKVKGQVSHIVTCLNDPCDKVRSLARLFFNELAKRSNNPVYNLLGDIIGTLSRADDAATGTAATIATAAADPSAASETRLLSTHEFQSTMVFLLGFVKKDKQGDALVERLLNRLGLAQDVVQRRNLAFCIAQLPFTEKGVKKMIELIRVYKDCLHDDEVYEYFYTAVSKAKKAGPSGAPGKATAAASSEGQESTVDAPDGAEAKNTVEEFLCIMDAVRDPDAGDLNLDNFVSSTPATGALAKPRGKKPPRKSTAVKPTAGTAKGKTSSYAKAAPKKKANKKKKEWSSDEEEAVLESDSDDGAGAGMSDDDFSAPTKQKVRGTTSRTRKPLAEAN